MRTRSRFVQDRRRIQAGAAVPAIVAPVLIMLFFAMVQLGLGMHRSDVIEAAALEAARAASLGAPAEAVSAAGKNAASGFVDEEVDVDTSDLCEASGDQTFVTVSTVDVDRLGFDLPVVGAYRPTYSATVSLPCEQATRS